MRGRWACGILCGCAAHLVSRSMRAFRHLRCLHALFACGSRILCAPCLHVRPSAARRCAGCVSRACVCVLFVCRSGVTFRGLHAFVAVFCVYCIVLFAMYVFGWASCCCARAFLARHHLLTLTAAAKDDALQERAKFAFLEGLTAMRNARGAQSPETAFQAHITKCLEGCERKDFLAAYTCIFQSSGVGKSLLALVMQDLEYIVYICLRPIGSKGYPSRSPAIADALTSATDKTAMFTQLNFNIALEIKKFMETTTDPSYSSWNQYTGITNLEGPVYAEFLRRLLQPRTATELDEMVDRLPVRVLVFLDEAHALLGDPRSDKYGMETFRKVRQAWKESEIPANMIFVLVDTLSSIANFTPTSRADPSLRPFLDDLDEASTMTLAPPFWLIDSMDKAVLPEGHKFRLLSYVSVGRDAHQGL
eukprot:m.215339 g.215339  ORF g.215339 m.215339 type:complete len:420 (+) comp10148_c0_seq74:727-1986(+)